MLRHGDGRAIGVPVRKALLELGGVILAQQINPLTQKTQGRKVVREGASGRGSSYRKANHPRQAGNNGYSQKAAGKVVA